MPAKPNLPDELKTIVMLDEACDGYVFEHRADGLYHGRLGQPLRRLDCVSSVIPVSGPPWYDGRKRCLVTIDKRPELIDSGWLYMVDQKINERHPDGSKA